MFIGAGSVVGEGAALREEVRAREGFDLGSTTGPQPALEGHVLLALSI